MNDAVAVPLAAILMPLILVPTVMVLRHSTKQREWRHLERMKAMERGIPVPGTEAWTSRVAIAVGAIMPVGVFGIAWLTSLTSSIDEVWIAATLVGGAGVFGGIRLASQAMTARTIEDRSASSASPVSGNGKPSFDPDAYEAIIRHG